jgi:hypothetical protein
MNRDEGIPSQVAAAPVDIAANLAGVRARIGDAAARSGRRAEDVLLVAVSKTYPLAAIAEARAAGQHDFGENRLEELWPKVHAAEKTGLLGIRWHMIGTIQSRKSADAVGPFALIHSVDRLKLANRLSRDAQAAGCTLDVLLEVNVSGEASKHGLQPAEVLADAPALAALAGIRIRGLMTMAPLVDDPEQARPVFRRLRELRDRLCAGPLSADWRQLSMGMSNDFEIAIEEGATIVRIGSAIFGRR